MTLTYFFMTKSFGALPAISGPLWNFMFPLKGYHCSNYTKQAMQDLVIKQHEEAKLPSARGPVNGSRSTNWVPHPRTGIYFPPGHEQVMEDVPTGAATCRGQATYWLRNVEGVDDPYPETPTDNYLL